MKGSELHPLTQSLCCQVSPEKQEDLKPLSDTA